MQIFQINVQRSWVFDMTMHFEDYLVQETKILLLLQGKSVLADQVLSQVVH